MSNIKEKTLGQLIDELFTTDHRCWNEQDKILDTSLSSEERLTAAVRAQQQNAKRTELIRAIDSLFEGTEFSNVIKTYHSYIKEVNK
jgi:hypothetical protein